MQRASFQKLSMECNIIHACKMGCILYRGVYVNLHECPNCGSPTYKQVGHMQVPTKNLCHFSIIPCLIWFYRSLAISKLLVWHHENKSTNGLVRHVVDSKTWMHIDNKWPNFAVDLRNIRFGLSTNEFNPFSDKTCIWSTWPVMLLVYNLPLQPLNDFSCFSHYSSLANTKLSKRTSMFTYNHSLMNSKNYGNPVFQHGTS